MQQCKITFISADNMAQAITTSLVDNSFTLILLGFRSFHHASRRVGRALRRTKQWR
ncbi:MAG: hypothetical protein GPOALKHO_001866 [Sodalis sp.]|uniref:hypothetical protein n=1 Tax=Sodalis sp. (in: enterobacteria) TaxID=1898979 RepID=UPI003872D2E9|nr:MAG: hypothetical protein GPOALKHO_001866 [Sodalis sp.]